MATLNQRRKILFLPSVPRELVRGAALDAIARMTGWRLE
jgi:hypothetical protein